ncbi:MAG: hypothetical protein Q9187_008494 [Circinaria calcarea]
MPPAAISTASIKEALSFVNRSNLESLIALVEKIEKVVSDSDTDTDPEAIVIPVGEISEREVFEVFGLANSYEELGFIRRYIIPEMKAQVSSTQSLVVPNPAKEILESIAKTWPPCNKSNVRVFISMVIHFAVVQINDEVRSGHDKSALSPKCMYPPTSTLSASSPLALGPNTPEQQLTKLKSSSEHAVTLMAYTEVPLSFETMTAANNEKLVIHGVLDYGISYSLRTLEALDTVFAVVEAKAVGELNGQTWAQLLCSMGMFQPPLV